MILFYFSEAFRSIKSAKSSFILTTISLSISVLLILFSIIAIQISTYYSSGFKSSIKINVFIKDDIEKSDLQKFRDELNSKKYSRNIQFISKDEAAEKFIKETGEDFRKILDYNPLPASFIIRIDEKYANADSLKAITNELATYSLVDEVVFREGFIYSMLKYLDNAKIYLFILTVVVCLIALYLIYATIKLIINSRMIEFETMKLVGAKLSTIKIPVVLYGIVAGIFAGLLSFATFTFFLEQIKSFSSLSRILNINFIQYLIIIFSTGPILVLVVSFITLRKVSLKI